MGKKTQYGPPVRRLGYDPSYCLAKFQLGNRVRDAVVLDKEEPVRVELDKELVRVEIDNTPLEVEIGNTPLKVEVSR
jgi:2-phospho-L-lactate transferase/gluconeogenesis factor (CofD/UPF0052 family)